MSSAFDRLADRFFIFGSKSFFEPFECVSAGRFGASAQLVARVVATLLLGGFCWHVEHGWQHLLKGDRFAGLFGGGDVADGQHEQVGAGRVASGALGGGFGEQAHVLLVGEAHEPAEQRARKELDLALRPAVELGDALDVGPAAKAELVLRRS